MDEFTRSWIIENGVPIVESYGDSLTIRALHYRLVAIGMTNSIQHYKRVVAAMGKAWWDGTLPFDAFRDLDRDVVGETRYEITDVDEGIAEAKKQIGLWMKNYYKNRWENQPKYVEVFIEKKALQGVFEGPCRNNRVALAPCKGYPSLTYMHDAANRMIEAESQGKETIILYFGDYDPSGEDIPRSIQDTMLKMGADVRVERILLLEEHVRAWGLPPAPTKLTDSRSKAWNGLGQVELDAVEPNKLKTIVSDAIDEHFDDDLHAELEEQQEEEGEQYKEELKKFVKGL